MAFNPKGKPMWEVQVVLHLKNGQRLTSTWAIVASSAATATQRGVHAAMGNLRAEKVPGRSQIIEAMVSAVPDA